MKGSSTLFLSSHETGDQFHSWNHKMLAICLAYMCIQESTDWGFMSYIKNTLILAKHVMVP